MPLEYVSEAYDPQIEGLYFPMRDSKSKQLVRCRVTWDYLEDLSGDAASATQDSSIQTFKAHRASIEEIASQTYDDGQNPPSVTGPG